MTAPTVQPGEPAPDFDLPMVASDGRVTLADYRGRTHLFLVLLRSFECPFCRRQLAALKHTMRALEARGVETLAVTTTGLKASRLYTRYRAPEVPLAADPKLGIHKSYGVPIYRFVDDGPTQWPLTVSESEFINVTLNPGPDVPVAMTLLDVGLRMDEEDGFTPVETDEQGPPDDLSPLVSYSLIDRAGIVRWVEVIAYDDPADYASHPSTAEIVAAADAL
jgi:peroxiredoxin